MIRASSSRRPSRARRPAAGVTYDRERASRGIRDSIAVTAHVHRMTREEVCELLGLDPKWAFEPETENE